MQTQHSLSCTRVFKKYDPSCPRCKELIAGAKPREGWQKQYFANKERDEKVWHSHLESQHCNHGSENLNPGGYCNICGKGTDFS